MMPARVDDYETLLTENRIWLARLQNVGKSSCEDAIAHQHDRADAARRRLGLRQPQSFPIFQLRGI